MSNKTNGKTQANKPAASEGETPVKIHWRQAGNSLEQVYLMPVGEFYNTLAAHMGETAVRGELEVTAVIMPRAKATKKGKGAG